jgi:hypothetical protein
VGLPLPAPSGFRFVFLYQGGDRPGAPSLPVTMSDVLIYWRDYRKNLITGVTAWHSNARLLGKLLPGDLLWFVTSGKNLQQEAESAGYLVAVWQVEEVTENPGDNPTYPKTAYRWRILANEAGSVEFEEPVLVDPILRPAGRDSTVSIGRFLQGPRKLKDQTVRRLREAVGPQMDQMAESAPRDGLFD